MKCDCCGCVKTEEDIIEEINRIRAIQDTTDDKVLRGILSERILALGWVLRE